MSNSYDDDDTNLMADALHQAIDRLRSLGLVDGDAGPASAVLTRSILEVMEHGERDQENLILYAIGRFRSDRPAGDRA